MKFFKKEQRLVCDFAYEYSFISTSDSPHKAKLPPTIPPGDVGYIEGLCLFEHAGVRYFVLCDRVGRLLVFDYTTGVELRTVLVRGRAVGFARIKKFITLLHEKISDLQANRKRLQSEKLGRGIVVKATAGTVGTEAIIAENTIIDNYDTSVVGEANPDDPDAVREREITQNLDELQQIHTSLVGLVNKTTDEARVSVEQFAEEKIQQVKEHVGLDAEKAMVTSARITDVVYLDGYIFFAYKREVFSLPFEQLLNSKDHEVVFDENPAPLHDGTIRKLHTFDHHVISLANDTKICFWQKDLKQPVFSMIRNDDEYYSSSCITTNNMLLVTGSSEVLAFELHPGDITQSRFFKALLHNNKPVHEEAVNIIYQMRNNKILTASSDGVVAVWTLDLAFSQRLVLTIQTTEQKQSLHLITSIIAVQSEGTVIYYMTFGGWIVGLEERNEQLQDVSPRRSSESLGVPFGRYNVDLSHLLLINQNMLLAVTGENGTVHILQNVKEKKRDVLKFLESKKLSGKINFVAPLDPSEGSFLIAMNNESIIMLKDSAVEMRRRQEEFRREIQAF